MDWEEFTNFVIEQILAISLERHCITKLKLRETTLGNKVIKVLSRLRVNRVRYIAQLNRFFVCSGSTVQASLVWDPTPRGVIDRRKARNNSANAFLFSVLEQKKFRMAPTDGLSTKVAGRPIGLPEGDMQGLMGRGDENKSPAVLDIKHMSGTNLLVLLRSDRTIGFLTADTFARCGYLKTSSQQYVQEYCPVTGLLFTSGCDGVVLSWALDVDNETLDVTASREKPLRRHTNIIKDMLYVQDKDVKGGHCLVTSGLDRGVHMWDTAKGKYMQSKTGNCAAIQSLAFDPGNTLLLGAGVEGEVIAWDLWGKLGAPLFRLQGHWSVILRVVCAPYKGRAASLDEKGRIMLWDTRRDAAVDTNERWLKIQLQEICFRNRFLWYSMQSHNPAMVCDNRRWSHVGVTVVAIGRRLHLYDEVDPRVAEPCLNVALYSPECVSFVTCNADLVTLWDAYTGKAIRSRKACQGEILCAALDSGARKLFLCTSLGKVYVYNFLQGVRITAFTPGHKGPISCLGYVGEDKVLLTGGWDRTLRVYDEVSREGDSPLLRQVDAAHASDINALAVSQMFCLVATGSAGGTCRLWDFQFLSNEGMCQLKDEVMCLCFLEPYPLLVVGDCGGRVSFVPVR
ncbi:unnamed protein product [Choristocarpus tenellus]